LTGLRSRYEQLDAIILTESTFSFGALALELLDALVLELDDVLEEPAFSTVPVISTLWPTCAVSWLSSASSRYDFALDDADGLLELVVLVPEVPAVLLPAGTVFNTNFVSLEALVLPDVPVDPGVALGAALERSMQPVTVILLAALELGVCDEDDGGVVCAAIVTVHAIAAHVPNHRLFVIVSS
jgi:hypothetical protein